MRFGRERRRRPVEVGLGAVRPALRRAVGPLEGDAEPDLLRQRLRRVDLGDVDDAVALLDVFERPAEPLRIEQLVERARHEGRDHPNTTGISVAPRSYMPTKAGGAASGSSRRFGRRSRSALMPTDISARATCMPRHTCGPPPNARVGFCSRPMSYSSGSSQRAGSRLAAPRQRCTTEPRGMWTPWKSTSRAV